MSKKDETPTPTPMVNNDAILMIPVSNVKVVKDFNARLRLTDINALAGSIARDGQRQPGTVYQDPDDPKSYILVEGHRRLAACKKAKIGFFRAQLTEQAQDPAEARWYNVLENVHRNGINGFEIARALYDYSVKANLPKRGRGTQIAQRFGMGDEGQKLSPSHVNNLLRSYEQLTPKANELWSKGAIKDETVFKLAAIPHPEQEKVLDQARSMSAKDFGDFLQQRAADAHDAANKTEPNEPPDKPPTKRPSVKQLKKAIIWARVNDFDDVEQVLKWALGVRRTMVFDGAKFDENWNPPVAE